MNSARTDIRNAALCGSAVVFACLLVWPFANMPFDDDWSYAFTVKRLAETGHLIYNGWSSPSLISQAYWALIWVKLLGFSFNVLRLSTIPLAGGSAAVTYLLARRSGLLISSSVFSALLLGISPLFLPLATSFMTDVPGCFCLLLSIYALVRAGQSASFRWMLVGFIIGAIGGSSRQIVWVVPFALLPYIAWIRRRDRIFFTAAVSMWIIVLIAAGGIQHWFETQPYSIPEPSVRSEWIRASRDPTAVITRFIMILIMLMLLTLPAGVSFFSRLRHSRSLTAISGLMLLVIGRVLLDQRRYAVGPWMINILSAQGVMAGGLIRGYRPDMLPSPIFPVLSLIVFATIAMFVASLVLWLTRPIAAWRWISEFYAHPSKDQLTVAAMTLVCGCYLALLLTRCAMEFTLFDRHLIGLIACVSIPMLRCSKKIPIGSWVLLGLFSIYAIGSTQENLAACRARATAVQRLRDAGIPRTQFSGGFDYDAWTQVETTGYINDSRIKLPIGAFHPAEPRMPDLKPVYRVEYAPTKDSQVTQFGSVPYFSLWPPFTRRIYIDRIVTMKGSN